MIFPWTSVGSLYGDSNPRGFVLNLPVNYTWETRGYREGGGDINIGLGKYFRAPILFTFLVILSFFLGWLMQIALGFFVPLRVSSFHWVFLPSYFLLGFGFVVLINALISLFYSFFRRSVMQYHACEHKTAVLLSEMFPATAKNLRKMPKTLFSCGMSLNIRDAQSFIFLGLAYLFFVEYIISVQNSTQDLTVFYFAAFSAFTTCCLFLSVSQYSSLCEHTRLHSIFMIATFPLWILPLGIEYISLREPSDEILQEGVEIVQRIYDDLGITPRTQN